MSLQSSSSIPSVSQGNLRPQLLLYINNIFIPTESVDVTLSAYGSADTVIARTYFHDLSDDLKGVSLAQLSQKVRPCPVTVKVVNHATGQGPYDIFQGILDELDVDFDTDELEIRARGILAILIDQRMSLKVNQNVDIGSAMSKLITSYGLKASVPTAGITVGHALSDDHVAHGRNVRVFDFIRSLASEIGWDVRVRAGTVVVGPVADRTKVPEFVRKWGSDTTGLTKLRVTHSALHSHDVKVKVLSYIPKTKGRQASNAQGSIAALLGLPAPLASTHKTSAGGTGRQSSGFTSVGESINIENEYVIHVVGKTTDQCDKIAANLRDNISRHEFVYDMAWAPADGELKQLAGAGCEFTVRLEGTVEPAFNQSVTPREVKWAWSTTGGLVLSVSGNNLPLPDDSGAGGAL
jgi:hypothetical protein